MTDSASTIHFLFRGQPVSVPAEPATRTVLQWLREDAQACGSKEGCAEGDCGACTVLVAEPLAELAEPETAAPTRAVLSQGLAIRPVNACIRFLPTLHGKALLTVEDLAAVEGPGATGAVQLHPAQQALVDHHGSQCGFCTPGFVMTMAAEHERCAASGAPCPGRAELADALAGNLCRCTGYRPILDAAQAMFDQPEPRLPLAGLREQLLALRAAHPAPAALPQTEDALAYQRLAQPEARLVAGATDVGLWVTKQLRELGPLLFLGDVPTLRQISADAECLTLGAAVTLEDAWAALVAHWPTLAEMARRFAGPTVRHAGTLVGNLANGSPIGDGAPVLIALGATLQLRRGDALRELPLQDFYLDYMKNALQPGEYVRAVRVPLATATATTIGPGWQVQAYKLSKRFDSDISAVSAGFALRLAGDTVAEARLAFGGLAGIVKRAAGAEAAILGQPWTEPTLRAAQAALAQDFQPLSDLRASAAYRRRSAAALLERLWLSTRPSDPVPLSALRITAVSLTTDSASA